MPVRYIRGTGSNIGLFVGVEYDANGKKGYPKNGPGMGANHGRGDGGYGPGPGGSGQGGGRPASPAYLQAQIQRTHERLENRHIKGNFIISPLHSWLPRNYPTRSQKNLQTGTDDFQLLPLTRFTIDPNGGVQEILLPILCQDIFLPVPDTDPNYGFERIDLRVAVPETYVGVYRFDQYIADHIAPHAWIRNGWIAASSGLSDEEFNMLTYTEMCADSSRTQIINGETFYGIEHAYLNPGLGNYPIWVPNENQSLLDCGIGIDSIWYGNHGSDTTGLFDFKQAIFELNHYIFHFAQLHEESGRILEAFKVWEEGASDILEDTNVQTLMFEEDSEESLESISLSLSQDTYDHIMDLLVNDELEEALEDLRTHSPTKELIILMAKLKRNNKDRAMGLKSKDDYSVERNTILRDILDLIK